MPSSVRLARQSASVLVSLALSLASASPLPLAIARSENAPNVGAGRGLPIAAWAPFAPVDTDALIGVSAPTPPPPCSATADDGANVYAAVDASAVRSAIAAAPAGGTVKIAGECAGAILEGATVQVALLTKELTLIGGYAPPDWATSNPSANHSTLNAQSLGRVIYATAPVTVIGLRLVRGFATTTEMCLAADIPSTAACLSQSTTGFGAGLLAAADATILDTGFYANQATGGVAARMWAAMRM